MDLPLLSDLCAICHAEKPKYRCPRCKGRTCSLNCYKRHQQRASCSGKRDPATYVKKAQLATPTGIDRDYNYLKSIERTIDDASQNVVERRIGTGAYHKSKVAHRGWHPDSAFQKYLNENRITVQHAPKGMSREKYNNTRITKGGSLVWTIEWVDGAGKRDVQHDCAGTKSIAEIHALFKAQQSKAEKRRLDEECSGVERHNLKRKRTAVVEDHGPFAGELSRPQEHSSQHANEGEAAQLAEPDNTLELTTDAAVPNDGSSNVPEGFNMQHNEASDASSPPVHFILESETAKEASPKPSEIPATPQQRVVPAAITAIPNLYYYLLKPNTAGASRVLMPLAPQTSLTKCLRDRTVQEYPTIYVLDDAPDALSAEFILPEQYERNARGIRDHASDGGTNLMGYGKRGKMDLAQSGDHVQPAADELDASSILAMLKRDVLL